MTLTRKNEIFVTPAVLEAVASPDRVDQPPRNFYKYPAGFSREFARNAIKAFARKGDTVIGPFRGGGTCAIAEDHR